MENNFTKKINQAVESGYYLDFGTVIEKSFDNYKKIALTGGLAILLITIVILALMFGLIAIVFGIADFSGMMTNFNPLDFSAVGIAVYILVVVLLSGLTAPIGAGFLKMAYLAEMNKPFSVGTVFDYYKTAHFKELFIAVSLIAVVNMAFTVTFEVLMISFVGSILTYILAFFTLLTVPLIIFGNQTGLDAIGLSFKLVLKQPVILLGLAIVSVIFVLLGFIGLCIGVFFTMPFWYSFLYTTYNSIFPIEELSEIETIGISEE